MSIDVVVVDDHRILQDGLRQLLDRHSDIRVVGVAGDGNGGVAAVADARPGVVVMDLSLPGLSGMDATRQIAREFPETAVLILSANSSPAVVGAALAAGARGYVLKESTADELVAAVRALAAGRRYLSEEISTLAETSAVDAGNSPLDALTSREREILQLIVAGSSNAEAARVLGLSTRTVETYRGRMMEKLSVGDLPALVKFAIRHGITGTD